MLRKTVKYGKRTVKHGERGEYGGRSSHTEFFMRETWWLLFVLPIYSCDSVKSTKGLSE